MKYTVSSRHAEDVGLARPVQPGAEFDDKEVPDHRKDHLKSLIARGRVQKVSSSSSKKSGGE